MDLKTYVDGLTPDQRKAYAERAGTTVFYLSQLIHGHRRASPKLSKALREASEGAVSLGALRPDIWGDTEAA